MPRTAFEVIRVEKGIRRRQPAVGDIANSDREQDAVQAVLEEQRIGPIADQETVIVGLARICHTAVAMPTIDVAPVQVEMFVAKTYRYDVDLDIGIAPDSPFFVARVAIRSSS
jgi:hypothetical protein